jgi:hypothetical protein
MLTVIELVLSLVAILGTAVIFTNAVEILGERLNLGYGAAASMLIVRAQDPAFSSSAYYCRGFYGKEEE